MRDWESQFREWAKAPGTTEQQRCDNAASAVINAINASEKLKDRDIIVFTQGSYHNKTNVKQDSDVDIAVVCRDYILHNVLPGGLDDQSLGLLPTDYTYKKFKNEIEEALIAYFGNGSVTRGNKAFDVKENSYHVEADVAPFFIHRRYSADKQYIEGVELLPDTGSSVINWPDQHYQNGVGKNNRTNKRYKSMVRILKALSNEMIDKGKKSGTIPSFVIECLVWNSPDKLFGNVNYRDDLKSILAHLYENTKADEPCSEWGEVSELKYLFRNHQKCTREEVNKFIVDAWNYAELTYES